MRVTIEDGVYSLVIEVKIESMFDNGKGRMIRWYDGSGDENGIYKAREAPVKSSPPENQHTAFYRPDALPVAHPTVSKHWRENATFHGLADPKLTWVFQSCLWPLKAPGYLGGRTVKTLVSPLTLVPFSIKWQLIKIILIRVLVTEPMKAFFVISLVCEILV